MWTGRLVCYERESQKDTMDEACNLRLKEGNACRIALRRPLEQASTWKTEEFENIVKINFRVDPSSCEDLK